MKWAALAKKFSRLYEVVFLMAAVVSLDQRSAATAKCELRLSSDPERLCKAVFLMAALLSAN